MEPRNATIRFDGDRAEAWIPTQFQTLDQVVIGAILGLKPEQVTLHTEYAGGALGRRGSRDVDVSRETAAVAKGVRGTPIKVVWPREDDMRGGRYRPMCVHRVEVGMGRDGVPAAWKHVVVGKSFMIGSGSAFEAFLVKDGVDVLTVEGTADPRYSIPNFHVSAHHPVVNVPVLAWRSVGYTHNSFVMETLIDELAVRAKTDPIAYRLELLDPGARKQRAALALLQEKSAWRNTLPRGHAAGIACTQYHDTAVACAVDVSIVDKRPRIHRATVTIDCGLAVNPLSVGSQVQGGLGFGLSQLLAPVAIDVHIVPSTEAPTGAGEPPVPVISPAVVNALARLTGKRYRSLPLVSL